MSEPTVEEEWRLAQNDASELLKEHIEKYSVYWPELNCTATCGADGQPACTAPPINALTIVTLLVIFCIAIAVGTDITFDQVRIVWRSKKTGFLIGCLSQYGFMPAISLMAVSWIAGPAVNAATSAVPKTTYVGLIACALLLMGEAVLDQHPMWTGRRLSHSACPPTPAPTRPPPSHYDRSM